MEGKRFDSFTKSLAAWSSRRKFLGGLTGAAAGTMLVRPDRAFAQNATVTEACGGGVSTANLNAIQDISSTTLANLPDPADFDDPTNPFVNRPQFPEFVAQIKCILTQGSTALSDNWTGEQFGFFLNQAKGLISAVSIGFTGSYFSDQPSIPIIHIPIPTDTPVPNEPTETPTPNATIFAGDPPGVRALLALTPSQVCHGAGCTADVIDTALSCYKTCNEDSTCYSDCFIGFVNQYVIGTTDTPSCIQQIKVACVGDCCGGGCHP